MESEVSSVLQRTADRREGVIGHMRRVETPIGTMVAICGDDGLRLLEFVERGGLERDELEARLGCTVLDGDHPVTRRLEAELDEYFAGRRREFTVPLDPMGTPFQLSVWAALREIPYGATRSYGEQARAIGRPDAVRAVAHANGDNPIAILVPCHRVIGANGKLTGYGGGLWRKRHLLDLESAQGNLALPTPR